MDYKEPSFGTKMDGAEYGSEKGKTDIQKYAEKKMILAGNSFLAGKDKYAESINYNTCL